MSRLRPAFLVLMRPLFSLIIPCYAAEKTLPRLLDSLKEQKGGVEFEAIFAVEPSNGMDLALLEEAGKTDPRIRVKANLERLGPMRSREQGLRLAQGEYVAFADADDYLSPYFFFKMKEGFDKGADAVDCAFAYLRNGKVKKDTFSHRKAELISGKEAAKRLLFDCSVRGFLWNKAFKRDLLLSVPSIVLNGRFEDAPFCFPFLLRSHQVALLPDPLYIYSKAEEGETKRDPLSRANEHLAAFASIRHYVDLYAPEFLTDFLSSKLRSRLSLSYDLYLGAKAGSSRASRAESRASFRLIYGDGLLPLEGRGYSPYLSSSIPYRCLSSRIKEGMQIAI